ncbi:hypothetical protein B9Z19DRAFT_540201 [Tuber borchii]|uniref:Uncharacterized protein n=1 Tax=Tuber borchii TaxID=42251 RepID=A0A2T6ZDA2_TUBBO|nr:hypothetical protein B9Z19DRAFT_540201 [Tuber borchii]
MLSQQNLAGQHFRSPQEGANPYLSSEYDTNPGVFHIPESGVEYNQKEPGLNNGLEQSKGKIWGMKRKTFMIVLGIVILLIIAIAAGVGGGVGGTAAKSNAHNEALELTKSDPQDSSILTPPTPTSSTPARSSSPSPTSSDSQGTLVTVTFSTSSSPTPTPIRNNTPLAAVNWNSSNIQLLYKHTDGSIRLQENNGLQWGEQSPQITKPKDDSGLAAISWLDGDVRQVRLYTASEKNALTESVWNSSVRQWWSQDISKGYDPIAAGSHLTAYTWFIGQVRQIRVYYQGQDGYIREAVYDKGWVKSAAPTIQAFPRAKSGSGLVVVLFPDVDVTEAKLFYQSLDGKLVSYDYQLKATFAQSWQNQDPTLDHGSIPDGAQVTAVSSILATGELTLRIYFIRDGKLVETWWTRKAGWNAWYMHDAVAPGVSAVSSTDDVNVFFQAKTGYLSDMGLNRYVNSWQFTAII